MEVIIWPAVAEAWKACAMSAGSELSRPRPRPLPPVQPAFVVMQAAEQAAWAKQTKNHLHHAMS